MFIYTYLFLSIGALLQAAVSSIEDHGYVMDIGIPNTRAFLPKESSNPDIELGKYQFFQKNLTKIEEFNFNVRLS